MTPPDSKPKPDPVDAKNARAITHAQITAIDQCLPQTQCTQCNYPSCLDYACAIATGEAEINQCPPGGDISIHALADLLSREAKPLNPKNGTHQPLQIAFIEEQACIGCKLCIAACPVDCIVGANKLMHTILTDSCSGCELCIPVCPTDCIRMQDPPAEHEKNRATSEPSLWADFSQPQVEQSRNRTQQKRLRVQGQKQTRAQKKTVYRRKSLKQEILDAVKRKEKTIHITTKYSN